MLKTFEEFCNEAEETTNIGTYVSVKVKNNEELYNWFKEQNVDMVPMEELHCTISYSRKEFQHIPNTEEVTITPAQLIKIEPLGDEGAVVLKFNSDEMQDRFQKCMSEGAMYDYDTYIPHITITYNGKDLDLSKIKLPNFDIILTGETVEPLDLNWKDKVTDKVNEMAVLNDIPADNNLSREKEWNNEIKDSPFTKLLVKDVNADKNDIYLYGTSTFYLADKDKQYLGHLDIDKEGDKGKIKHSYSKIKGFYLLMFPNILTYSNIKTILSDDSLSQGAINSYNKLHKIVGDNNIGVSTFKMSVLSPYGVLPFSTDNLMKYEGSRVMITEQAFKHLKESFESRITQIDEITKLPKWWKQKWDENNKICDQWLYGIR